MTVTLVSAEVFPLVGSELPGAICILQIALGKVNLVAVVIDGKLTLYGPFSGYLSNKVYLSRASCTVRFFS